MINLAIIIVHNKTNGDNFKQIETIKPLIIKQTIINTEYDLQSIPIGTFETYYYTIKGLITPHKVKFYQIIPFGITLPSNLYGIDSYKVFYGKGDEDKKNNHPRFFNWALKRGIDNGADIVIYLQNPLLLIANSIPLELTKLINNTVFLEPFWGKIATKNLLIKVGQLSENNSISNSLVNFRQRIIAKGLNYG